MNNNKPKNFKKKKPAFFHKKKKAVNKNQNGNFNNKGGANKQDEQNPNSMNYQPPAARLNSQNYAENIGNKVYNPETEDIDVGYLSSIKKPIAQKNVKKKFPGNKTKKNNPNKKQPNPAKKKSVYDSNYFDGMKNQNT